MHKKMPKRNGRPIYNSSGSRFSALKDYSNDHEDRSKGRNSTRRVSFKPSQPHSRDGIKNRLSDMAVRLRLEDDDDMGDFATTSRYAERNGTRRKGSPIPRGKFGESRKLLQSTFGWYQVLVRNGQRYPKDVLIRAILDFINPEIFIPHYWRIERHCVTFFVDEFKAAEHIQRIERHIVMPDNVRLFVLVRSGVPIVSVDDEFKQKMKMVMAKRYNAHTRALDLSKFYADTDFKDTFCSLFRGTVMSAAIDIMETNIPELEALNLNNNNLTTMEAFKNIDQRLPNLKVLYLGENKIISLSHLIVLRKVPIVELVLKANPLCNRFKNEACYTSEVRRKFPKLRKLDGNELEPTIRFDVHEVSSALPEPKASFLCDVNGANIVRQFLEQYFLIFDSNNRQPLLDAYHEQAMMSMTIPPISEAGRLNSFWKNNRNLLRTMNSEENAKFRQLKIGRLAVVSTLAEWPKTIHDPQSFSVDLTLFTPKMTVFSVGGLFKELDAFPSSASGSSNSNINTSTSSDIRYFQRSFVIVPAGNGFCIRNETIFITSVKPSQARTFMRPRSPVTVATAQTLATSPPSLVHDSSPVGAVQARLQQIHVNNTNAHVQIPTALLPTPSVPVTATVTSPDDATKMQMVQAMSELSKMNLDWSRKCLEETNWDYNHAAFVFDKLHKENKIPGEAFVK